MPQSAIATDASHSSLEQDSKTQEQTLTPAPASLTQSASLTETETKEATDEDASINTVTDSISKLSVNPLSVSNPTEPSKSADDKSSEIAKQDINVEEEELSPEEAKLRAKGLKSTHRPGFYIHIDSPKRLRIQTSTKTFDLDRYCPHANADMLKWGVLRPDMTLRCGVHYWGFDLVKNGQCIAHPEETLNACPVADSELQW
ncbi:hypothetical protein BGX28_004487 [Mortierella sp. GBA30]|nr:hypothetical protein BGX28_004487 [Mortierella sp. GBA30]